MITGHAYQDAATNKSRGECSVVDHAQKEDPTRRYRHQHDLRIRHRTRHPTIEGH
jgi:hypothetical protein